MDQQSDEAGYQFRFEHPSIKYKQLNNKSNIILQTDIIKELSELIPIELYKDQEETENSSIH